MGTAGKMEGKLKWIVLVLVFLFLLPLVRGTLFTWKVIDPGFTGIKINRLVNRGVPRIASTFLSPRLLKNQVRRG